MPKENLSVEHIDDYAHLDYVWGTDANTTLYPKIIKIIEKHIKWIKQYFYIRMHLYIYLI